MRDTVVVTDGEQRSCLAVVRSLGRAGYRVIVCGKRARTLAGASRYAERSVAVPSPVDDPEGMARRISEICQHEGAGALIPIADASIEAILPRAREFDPVLIPMPDHDRFRAVSDKEGVLRLADSLGIPIPPRGEIARRDMIDVDSLPSFPVVVKPSRSFVSLDDGGVELKVEHAETVDDLNQILDALPAEAFPVSVQSYIHGTGEGVFLLMGGSGVEAAFAHRRIREKPPSGGVSVYRSSIPVPTDTAEYSLRLLEALQWRGVAMVEFRRSAEDGRAYLMEINGRFWGSLQLAVDSGVDFPRLLLESMKCGPIAAPPTFRTGVRLRWWLGDLDQLLIRLRGRVPAYRLPPGDSGRLRALLSFLIPWRPGDRSEVFRLSDPQPAFHEAVEWFRHLLMRSRKS